MFDNFNKLVLDRQSCRDFNGQELKQETLEEIIRLSLLAPSACNSQPWKIYAVTAKDKLPAVAESLQDRGMNAFASGAKAFIVIAEKDATLKERVSTRFDRNHFVKYDIGELVAYITLAAESKGVASCILGWINQDKLKIAVNLADGEVANIVIALGYTDIPKRAKVRKSESEVVLYVKD
jgi:nitroreductase